MVGRKPEYAPTAQSVDGVNSPGWDPKEYSSDPDYDSADIEAAFRALESIDADYEGQVVMTDGGYDRDPRVVDAERFAGVKMDRPGNRIEEQRPSDKEPHTESPGYEKWAVGFEDEKVMNTVTHFFGKD